MAKAINATNSSSFSTQIFFCLVNTSESSSSYISQVNFFQHSEIFKKFNKAITKGKKKNTTVQLKLYLIANQLSNNWSFIKNSELFLKIASYNLKKQMY